MMLTDHKLDFAPIYRKSTSVEITPFDCDGAHAYCPQLKSDGFRGFARDLEIIYPTVAHLLILTDQNWTYAPIYRKSTTVESKTFWWMELLNNAHSISEVDFGDLLQIWKKSDVSLGGGGGGVAQGVASYTQVVF